MDREAGKKSEENSVIRFQLIIKKDRASKNKSPKAPFTL